MKIPSWAQNGLMSPEMRLSVVRAMKGDNWAVEGEDRVIHCECGNDKGCKLCYGLPHCGCKLCYQPPLKRLSEVNFISVADLGNEDVETAPEIDTISYKVFRAAAVTHRHPSKDTQGNDNF